MAGEVVIASGLQKRIFALFSRRLLVAITPSRVLVIRRGLLGGFRMSDIQWKDLGDATLSENVLSSLCGSNLEFKHLKSAPPMVVDGVPSDTAATIYSHAQAEEQAWEEKRRVRTMEEIRAGAGGVTVHAPSSSAAAGADATSILKAVQQAKQLLDDGTISDAEFQEMKSKILSGAA